MTEEQRWVLRSVRNTVGHPINHDLADVIDAALRRIDRLEEVCRSIVKTWDDFGDDDDLMNPLDTTLPDDIDAMRAVLEGRD